MRRGMIRRLATATAARWATAICAFVCAIAPAFSYCVCSGRVSLASSDRPRCPACEAARNAEASSCCGTKPANKAEPVKACCRRRAQTNDGADSKRPTRDRRGACCVRFVKSVFWNDARTIQIERPTFLYFLPISSVALNDLTSRAVDLCRSGRELIRGGPPLFILLLVLRN